MQHQPVDYTRKWFVMAAVATGVLLATIDASIVNVALPTLTKALDADLATVEWVVLAYLLTITTLMLSVGRLADMAGKKSLYLAGIIIFTIGSMLCGLSSTIYTLIGFRVLQAVGAAMTTALGTAIVTEAFPPSERGKALGISGGLVSVGIVLGPTLGGILIEHLSWHWIFFVNLPVGIAGALMVSCYVPNFKPAGGQRFDFAGAGAMFLGVLCLLVALTVGQYVGFGSFPVVGLLVFSVVCLAGFIAVERRVAHPMIDVGLFRNRLFSVNLITGFVSFVAIAGTLILMPFYLEDILGFEPQEMGLLLAVVPIAMGLVAPLSGAVSDRVGVRPIAVVGLLTLLIGYTALTTLGPDTTAMGYALRFLPVGIGMGIFQSPNNSAIMGAVPRARLGIASGLLALTRTLGQTVGVSAFGALWAGQVMAHAGGIVDGGATAAPAAIQVAALHDTTMAIAVWVGLGLVLSVYAVFHERRQGGQWPVAADS
jgi:EmrB/QacA subfamily drug resistance transporter